VSIRDLQSLLSGLWLLWLVQVQRLDRQVAQGALTWNRLNGGRMSAGLCPHCTGYVGGSESEDIIAPCGRVLSSFCGGAMLKRQVL